MKLAGACNEQKLKRKVNEMGMSMLVPQMLALRAVQRQTAASKPTRPWKKEQQGVLGTPIEKLALPSSIFEHTPSLSVSRGHPAGLGLAGVGGFGVGGLGFGGLGKGQSKSPDTFAIKRMLSVMRKRAREDQVLGAIGAS